jgi:hypothetical protein
VARAGKTKVFMVWIASHGSEMRAKTYTRTYENRGAQERNERDKSKRREGRVRPCGI